MILSIIIPIFNGMNYLDQMFKSIEKEFYSDVELILIDDGSTDDSYKICEEHAENKRNVKIIKNTNHGVSFSRNCGLRSATGQYIMFLDSDDILLDGWYHNIISAIEKSNFSDIIVFQKKIYHSHPRIEEVLMSIIGIQGNLCVDYLGAPWSKVFRKKYLFDTNILFDEKIVHGEDSLLNIEAFINTEKYYFVDQSIYSYRVNFSSVTHRYNSDFLDSNERFLKRLSNVLQNSKKISNKTKQVLINHSFANSIYIFVGKVSKLNNYSDRLDIVKKFYAKNYYIENLKTVNSNKTLSFSKRIIFFFVKHKLFGLIEMIIPLIHKEKNKEESYLIDI